MGSLLTSKKTFRIYKDKYNQVDDDGAADDRRSRGAKKVDSPKKPRNKSRTRSIFHRKKSISTVSSPTTPTAVVVVVK